MESVETEIRSFYSLQDLGEALDEGTKHYEAIVEEYTQWLGLFLRDSEANYGDQEWFKKLSGMQKALKSGKKPEKKGKGADGKRKREASSPEWIVYKEILLCTNEQAQAEIVFDAIEEINGKIDKLEKIKVALAELEKSGLGTGITYIAFIRNGVPEKLVLRQKKDKELAERFRFATEISVPITM
jgi:hypothetical protein